MKRLKLALFVGGLGLVIGLLHALAINLYLYWELWWLDMLMHFLGGFWVALLGFWIIAFFDRVEEFSKKQILIVSVVFTLVIGLLWELFEAGAGLSFVGRDAWGDTILDIIFDIVGGLTAGYYIFKRYSANTKK